MDRVEGFWDRYRTLIGLLVMIIGVASRSGTNSWLLPILGVALGAIILALPKSSHTPR